MLVPIPGLTTGDSLLWIAFMICMIQAIQLSMNSEVTVQMSKGQRRPVTSSYSL